MGRPQVALRFAVVVIALCTGCEVVDNFDPFHVVFYDGGAADLAASIEDDSVRDVGARGDLAIDPLDFAASDLSMADLAVPDLSAVDLAPCGVCKPGDQRMVACGNCGMEADTCGMNCQWSAGACNGQGACAPRAKQGGGCDACSEQTCGNNCQWGVCQLKQGNACGTGDGRPCQNPGNCSSSQTCSNCQWPRYCCG